MSNANFGDTLVSKIECGSGVIWAYLPGGDEGYCERAIREAIAGDKERNIEGMGIPVYWWDVIHGGEWDQRVKDGNLVPEAEALKDPLVVLQAIPGPKIPQQDCAFIMRDLHKFLNHEAQFGLRRCLAELAKANRLNNNTHTRPIILMADTPTPHSDIKDYVDVIDFSLPNYEEMERDAFTWVTSSIEASNPDNPEVARCDDDLKDKIVRGLLGTSSEEAQRILAYAAATSGGMNAEVLEVIAKEKANVIRKLEGLTYVPYEKIPGVENFAGFDAFMPWLRKRGRAYSRHAQDCAQELPRGSVLIGPPGTGKTEVAKAAAKVLGLDLIVMDIGALFDKYVGGTEKKIRAAIQMVDAMPQCLLMVDEIDKVFAGAHENQSSDSGVSSRMLSTFLSWLSDRDVRSRNANRTFVFVTMNRTAGVPPEFLRAGRFDKVWSTDLPDAETRKLILEIHLRKRGVDPAAYGAGLKAISGKATDGFVGAEIEEIVRAARADAYDNRMTAWEDDGSNGEPPTEAEVAPTIEELASAADDLVPLSVLSAEDIKDIQHFCAEKTTPVSGKRAPAPATSRQKRRVSTGKKKKKDEEAVDPSTL